MIKERIPKNIKIKVHLLKNALRDLAKGYAFNYAKKRISSTPLITIFSITQDLKSNSFKKQNITIAKQHIETTLILPNEIFSFWKTVGNPSKNRGFVKSRSLINEKTIESYGGGLCQLSGLLYLTSLHCGLEILERHNHSIDIYNDATRYMPLGGDATVAFAYKDLKIRNTLKAPIKFTIKLNGDKITLELKHTKEIAIKKVEFSQNKCQQNLTEIHTMVNNEKITSSIYKKPTF